MIVNLFVIVFLILVVYFWALQGLFSAMLHAAAVIVAGALALAFWEPVAHLILGTETPAAQYAWGISLIGLFLILTLVLRMAIDRLVPKNVHFHGLVNKLGGAAFGLVAGIITAGMALLGFNHLPLAPDVGGFQPYYVDATGELSQGDDQLWVPVDRITANVYTTLAGGAFAPTFSDHSLNRYYPNLIEEAALFRMRQDENASLVAVPDSVQLGQVYQHDLPVDGLPGPIAALLPDQPGHALLMAETLWQRTDQTFDSDGTLRLPASQIRLVTRQESAGGVEYHSHPPFAFSTEARGDQRETRPFGSGVASAYASGQNNSIAWAFHFPDDHKPDHLRLRNLHFALPDDAGGAPENIRALLGRPADDVAENGDRRAGGPSDTGNLEGIRVRVDNSLPRAISRNAAGSLNVSDGAVTSGSHTVRDPGTSVSQRNRVDHIHQPSQWRIVRMDLDGPTVQSRLRATAAADTREDGVILVDEYEDTYYPIGYVIERSDRSQRIRVDFNDPIENVRDLPARDVEEDERLVLYFGVHPDTHLTEFRINNEAQNIDIYVE